MSSEADLIQQDIETIEFMIRNQLRRDPQFAGVLETIMLKVKMNADGRSLSVAVVDCKQEDVQQAILPLVYILPKLSQLAPSREEPKSPFWLENGRWVRASEGKLLDASDDPLSKDPAGFLAKFLDSSADGLCRVDWERLAVAHIVEDATGASEVMEALIANATLQLQQRMQ